jgi:hypothetical protein
MVSPRKADIGQGTDVGQVPMNRHGPLIPSTGWYDLRLWEA